MALAVFPTSINIRLTYQPNQLQAVGVITYFPAQTEQRFEWGSRDFAPIVLPVQATTAAERKTVDDFVRDRTSRKDSWLLYDPQQFNYTGLALGTSTPSQTVFDLPTTGVGAGFYPLDNASIQLYDDGTPVSHSAVDTDGRTVTATVAPTTGSVMTLDLDYYRRVRFESIGPWRWVAPAWERTFTVLEVPA